MATPLLTRIREVVTPPMEAAGYELVDAEWKHEPGGWVCRLYIDHLSRTATDHAVGITHADCERVSRELSAVLDVHEVISQAYQLEVSSPGLNRPLRSLDHFRRFVGKKARVRLKAGIEGRRNFSGPILAVKDQEVVLSVDGNEVSLPVSDVEKANLQYEFE